jgi:hypothetical protein
MASTPTFQPNPYANFDPSQWSNPYSQFAGKALPWPSSYAGTPNNALGQPIAPPQGMTLNQTPSQPQAPPGAQSAGFNAAAQAAFLEGGAGGNSYLAALGYGPGGSIKPGSQAAMYGGQQQGAPAASAPNNWQNTLSMLANPGQVTTPGATVPQAASSATPGPGVLQSFLANWQPQQSGPGSGFTQNFNTILRGLQAQRGS